MRRQVWVDPAFYARLKTDGHGSAACQVSGWPPPGVEEDFAQDVEGQLPAIEDRLDVRMVVGAGDVMTYAILADLDDAAWS